MLGLLIIAIIVFAFYERRRWRARLWERWDGCESAGSFGYNRSDARAWSESVRRHVERKAWAAEDRISNRLGRRADRFERKMRRRFDRQTNRWGGVSADPDAEPRPRQFASDEQWRAYQRARRRAAAKAGFYVHLLWYGLVIGFLFLINLLTTHFQWWLFPAALWGFGLASHFVAVFGWHWVHQRVFEPAIEREVEREVTREKEALRTEKQASLDELTATFAHEIRNPIAAAKSLVQQMGEDPASAENVEYARVALDELARVERSVSHLLKYAKQEDYHFDNVNLASVLDAALGQMQSKLKANSIAISRNYLGGPMVRADAQKLQSVFSNVIDNAIDAMGEIAGERRIELGIEREGTAMATVRIRDNGCGIAQDRLAKIFNPFYTSKENGTGLGLGVAKKIVDAHRGTIEVASEPGGGTQFKISLPIARAGRDEEQPQASGEQAGASYAAGQAAGQRREQQR